MGLFQKRYQTSSTAVCGLYYVTSAQQERSFLPQVSISAHANILQTTSRVTLTQTFVNPSTTKGILEVKYVFPLYEGVSVVGFTCHVADRVIAGEVKEKQEAKQDYTQAVARGETAGLFQQLDTSDTFMTTIGSVPPGARVDIKITYLGELKHDMEVDGVRFTIPDVITPRYGRTAPEYDAAFVQYRSQQTAFESGISVTIDAEMADGSFIQKILSPSHPISVSMGTTTASPNDEPSLTKASAALAMAGTHLEKDFVLQIVAKNTGVPKAILETHPTIPNQRALMATLVPKFALPPENPEIVFVCDRSGSMSGTNIELVKQALQVFLKSLPVGVMFNICSFGSHYDFLWPRSVAYSQQTLDEAVNHVGTFGANYGGTEMLAPLKDTLERRWKDIPLEVMMLTDGAIWDQQGMFSYLNEQIKNSKNPIRVYSLGIGSGVSHSLIEGLARAGNGFAQTVSQGENMNSKVVRMLKGALSPHVNDYTLEVKYGGSMGGTEGYDDDLEVVERVADSLKVKLDLSEEEKDEEKPNPAKPISLFDPSTDPDKSDPPGTTAVGEARFAHLPKVVTPNIIQAPQAIPPLFAFNRTTVYLLLGPNAPQQTPKSVVLRGTSAHGPLELEFPVQILDKPCETIHQLAAKKATYELEEGRGWLPEAKGETGKGLPLKERFEGRFPLMVEREAVRLGVQFQVSGKWCSFVAVEKEKKSDQHNDGDWEVLENEPLPQPPTPAGNPFATTYGGPAQVSSLFSSTPQPPTASLGAKPAFSWGGAPAASQGGSLFDSASRGASLSGNTTQKSSLFSGATNQAVQTASSSLFGSSSSATGPLAAPAPGPNQLFGGIMAGAKPMINMSQLRISQHPGLPRFHSHALPPLGKKHGLQPSQTLTDSKPGAQQMMSAYMPSSYPYTGSTSGGFSGPPPPAGSFAKVAPARELPPQATGFGSSTFGQTGRGLFGSSTSSTQAGCLFGNSTSSATGGALFGSNTSAQGRNLFFQQAQQQQQAQQAQQQQQQQQQQAPSRRKVQSFADPPQTGPSDAPQGNHVFQDYQMQMMLLEQQNKKRQLMARQEQGSTPSSSGPPEVQVDQAHLEQYQKEMQSATQIPLPGQDDDFDLGFDDPNALENFDFDSFLHTGEESTAFGTPTAFGQFSFDDGAKQEQPDLRDAETRLNALGRVMGRESERQSSHIDCMVQKTDKVDDQIAMNRARLDRIDGPRREMEDDATTLSFNGRASAPTTAKPKTDDEILALLISLQKFEGSWDFAQDLFDALPVKTEDAFDALRTANETAKQPFKGYGKTRWATALVIVYLEDRLDALKGSWELVVEKAKSCLRGKIGEDRLEEVLVAARLFYKTI